jgi:hypothetical protein
MRRSVLPLALMLAAAALPAAAQGSAPGSVPFPGIAWGVDADSVIRAWGEPVDRGTTRRGLDELSYLHEREGAALAWYVLVHPELGTVIAGYSVAFQTDEDCRALARAAFEVIARDYPRFRWQSARVAPAPAVVCGEAEGRSGAYGRDPDSGTRVGIRLGSDGERLTIDAISPAGWEWVGGAS